MDSTEASGVGSPRTMSGWLIDESALGAQHRDASLKTLGQQGIRLYREKKSASPNQHDNDHDDEDKYKCSSSNEHDSFLSLVGLSGVGVPPWGLRALWLGERQYGQSLRRPPDPVQTSNSFMAELACRRAVLTVATV